jgi:hypothetical protein
VSDDAIRKALADAGLMPASAVRPGARRTWSSEEIVESFIRFRDDVGRWPTGDDCNPSRLRRAGRVEELARFYALGLPYIATVYSHCGSWPDAVRAARRERARRTAA